MEVFKCNGVEYEKGDEIAHGSCEGCSFDEDMKSCDKAKEYLDCMGEGIIWIKKEPMKINLIETEASQCTESTSGSALGKQEGGLHYKQGSIQPVEYIHANNLSFLEGNVVKYVTRYKSKDKEKDIKKAIHYLELILELEYGQVK